MITDPAVPSRACCCPATPAVQVTITPGPGHPRPVDLWLCWHHYRVSLAALKAAPKVAGVIVEDPATARGSHGPQGSRGSWRCLVPAARAPADDPALPSGVSPNGVSPSGRPGLTNA
jgi:hypothetical protein